MHWQGFHGCVQGKIPQVFSLLRSRELRAMGPECIRNLGKEDLMELCLEELLGISSKRLCAILDGADPPTDTSSSESEGERLETVSLDSISSDELQQKDYKKKQKCKRKEEKSNKKSAKSDTEKVKSAKKHSKTGKAVKKSPEKSSDKSEDKPSGDGETRAAERAGMTVLELLELQARARAIRAQLALEHSKKATSSGDQNAAQPPEAVDSDSDDSVEIKEEPAQVVELLSSDEEDKKPDVTSISAEAAVLNEAAQEQDKQQKVTKKNDLTIIVPATQRHRKVKLNRSKSNVQQQTLSINGPIVKDANAKQDAPPVNTPANNANIPAETTPENTMEIKQTKQDDSIPVTLPETKDIEKKKRLKKVKKTVRREINYGSDHDEITLQLSDSEKMDLLEDLDRKNYDNVTSSDDASEESSEEDEESKNIDSKTGEKCIQNDDKLKKQSLVIINRTKDEARKNKKSTDVPIDGENKNKNKNKNDGENSVEYSSERIQSSNIEDEVQKRPEIETNEDDVSEIFILKTNHKESTVTNEEKTMNIKTVQDIPIQEDIVSSNLLFKDNKEQSKNNKEYTSNSEEWHENHAKDVTLNESCSGDKYTEQSDEDYKDKGNQQEITTSSKNIDKESEACKTDQYSEKSIVDVSDNAGIVNEQKYSKEDEIDEYSEKKFVDSIEYTENVTIRKEIVEQSTEEKEKSEGEISDRASSEVEMFEPSEEIVCISDEEIPNKKKKKEKKKKEKKSKKEKKKDFRERGDQNFNDESSDSGTELTFRKGTKISASDSPTITDQIRQISEDLGKVNSCPNSELNSDSEEIYEICEISDGDESCYEVDGVNISKEPTCEEIEALSAKIDTEIEREDIITEEQIRHLENKNSHEEKSREQKEENLEDVSWKDRYLDSSKVKKVLKTSNILNAMRKKNIELKKKLAESKKPEKQPKPDLPEQKVEEGSIEHFNTLQASSKYVDPTKEAAEQVDSTEKSVQQNVTNIPNDTKEGEHKGNEGERKELNVDMKNDAKQLLKMYKRLLKYNCLTKPTDQVKAKKKKNKKQKKNKSSH